MRVSVILSTFNAPEWLEKVIWGYTIQTHRDFEVLVADDGSTEDTARCVDRLRSETGLCLRHVWHERRGFRKCTILNAAIAASSTDYLVFSDGDCIPRCDFLAQHVHFARQRTLLSGGTVRLPMALSQRIGKDDILNHRATDGDWLLSHGLGLDRKRKMLTCGPMMARLLDALTPTRATWNGHNASAWKSDILRVNGYDERMEYGGLDRELGERLVNDGVRPKQIRHRAVCVHLDHARAYVRQDAIERNLGIRKETRLRRSVWTPHGIHKGAPPIGMSGSQTAPESPKSTTRVA